MKLCLFRTGRFMLFHKCYHILVDTELLKKNTKANKIKQNKKNPPLVSLLQHLILQKSGNVTQCHHHFDKKKQSR